MSKKAVVFEFTSYKFEPNKKRAVFKYKTHFKDGSSISFSETITIPEKPLKSTNQKALKKMLESLHIILGISYYKLYCPPTVAFAKESVTLSKKETAFWNTVYKKGLGEFFFRNALDPAIAPKFPYAKDIQTTNYKLQTTLPTGRQANSRCLVGIGGGKDSIVSLELLKSQDFDVTGFLVKTNDTSNIPNNIAKKAGINMITIKRDLDEKIYQKHQYSGHIPISMIYAFLGSFTSLIYGYSYIIVSNEYSSNFGNFEYKGLNVNHQWSKSFEAEKIFQEYLDNFISPNIKYFSLMRPFYEIRIAKLFSNYYKKYVELFSSCNQNFRKEKSHEGLWCNRCPKCVFSFILLSAFLKKEELISIFGENLYQKQSLLPLFKDVLGLGDMKPFDCVGTFEESQTAFFMAAENFKDDFMVRQLLPQVKYSEDVLKIQRESNIPEQFKLLGMDNILILGYGKEGKATEKYIKKYYPKASIKIADQSLSQNYLENQDKFDIAIKTPGVNKELVKIPYTTATNIFFSKVSGKNLIIGVTGSKGKSTTSSLIFSILKSTKKDVELLGNIGKPMLEHLMLPVKKGKIFVLELSSYQLDDIKFSPDISVLTNLFLEHLDYHKSLNNYYQAKKNIINFQNENGFFVYNPDNKESVKWLKDYKGNKIAFFEKIPVKEEDIHLMGKHNQNNIRAAISVAKILTRSNNFAKNKISQRLFDRVKISNKVISSAIKNFKGLPNRLELVGKFKGIIFYNDASSTNPDSSILAIESLKDIDTIFLGGQDRGYDFSHLEKVIKKYKIRNIVLFPDSGEKIIKNKSGLNILNTESMEEAVKFAYQNTLKGKICLLSGASPSYSLWKNFEEKGDQFKHFVKKLNKQ